jgi:hypothetical protein
MIGLVIMIISGFAVKRFGTLGKISERFRNGTFTMEDQMYMDKQPNWIIDNPSLTTLFGNLAPFTFLVGLVLLFMGI